MFGRELFCCGRELPCCGRWFCERKGGDERRCWSRHAFNALRPLPADRRPTKKERRCLEFPQIVSSISRYMPGETLEDKLTYAVAGQNERPSASYTLQLCRFLKAQKARQEEEE